MVVVELFRCPVGESGVRPDTIVIVAPGRQQLSRLAERREQRLVEEFVAQPPVKTLDERVLLRLAGLDVMPVDAGGLAPLAGSPCWSVLCRCRRHMFSAWLSAAR